MMREPEQIERVVSAAVRATKLPVTAKIRAGWDETCINAPEVAELCERAGASAVAVHARTRAQQYAGRADWRIIREVKARVSIPVLGNGDVRSGADALRMMEETGCDGVIVGRAAQGNPWIFGEIRAAMLGRPWRPPSPGERVEMALRHFELESALHGEKRGLLEMRKHIAWYVSGLPGASHFRQSLNDLTEPDAVRDALCAFGQACEKNA